MLKKCPCCGKNFTKWNYGFNVGVSSFKLQKDYWYFYCIFCNNQISTTTQGKSYKYIFIGVLGLSLILAQYIGGSIDFLDGVNIFLVGIPIIATVLLFIYIGIFYIFTFYCYESNTQSKANESPNENLSLVNHIVEKSAKSLIKFNIARIIILIIILVFSLFWLK